MSYIKTISHEDATGSLKRQYDAALKRAGRIYNVVSVQSLNPPVMDASIKLYHAMMHGPSSLSRRERELIAVVVSRANDCFY
jgi:alkylhydroperoxidase family enzyme